MQAELQTAIFQAFDTLNLQRVKTFSVPPVTLCGLGALSACGQEAQARGVNHLFVMVDSFLHQAGLTAGLARSLAVKGVAMTVWLCPPGEPCVTDVCAAVAQLREAKCDGVVAFGGGSVLDAAKAVALLVTNPEQTPASAADCGADHRRNRLRNHQRDGDHRCGQRAQAGAGPRLAHAGRGDSRRRPDRRRSAPGDGDDRDRRADPRR